MRVTRVITGTCDSDSDTGAFSVSAVAMFGLLERGYPRALNPARALIPALPKAARALIPALPKAARALIPALPKAARALIPALPKAARAFKLVGTAAVPARLVVVVWCVPTEERRTNATASCGAALAGAA